MDEAAARTRAETPAEREEAGACIERPSAPARDRQAAAKERGRSVGGRGSSPEKGTGGQAQICEQEGTERLALERLEAKRREREQKLRSGPVLSAVTAGSLDQEGH